MTCEQMTNADLCAGYIRQLTCWPLAIAELVFKVEVERLAERLLPANDLLRAIEVERDD